MRNAKYHIHTIFETKMPAYLKSQSVISGSLLIDSALTEEEVKDKVAMYKARSTEEGVRYVYSENRAEWYY